MTFPHPHHDHARCVAQALDAADEGCRRSGARLTDLRRRVLELVWCSHRPVGAYAVLEALGRDGFSPAPPTVYRALDFLLAQGLIHRIERLNAFVGCTHPGQPHGAHFLLCSQCGAAAELNDSRIDNAVEDAAGRLGFTVARKTVEVEGLCPACQSDPQA